MALQELIPDAEYCVYCHAPAAGLCADCGAMCCGDCVELVLRLTRQRAVCRSCLAAAPAARRWPWAVVAALLLAAVAALYVAV